MFWEDEGVMILPIILFVLGIMLIGKLLAAIGLLTKKNSHVVARWVSGAIGLVYGYGAYHNVKNGWPPLLAGVIAAVFLSVVIYLFVCLGLGAVAKDDKQP